MEDNWHEVMRGVIHPWHHDQFGHMNVRWYAHFFDDAVFHMYAVAGLSLNELLNTHGVHTVSARATTNFVHEAQAGDLVRIVGAITRVGGKSVTLSFQMLNTDSGELHSTYDLVEVCFDPKTRKSATFPPALRAQLEAQVVATDDDC